MLKLGALVSGTEDGSELTVTAFYNRYLFASNLSPE